MTANYGNFFTLQAAILAGDARIVVWQINGCWVGVDCCIMLWKGLCGFPQLVAFHSSYHFQTGWLKIRSYGSCKQFLEGTSWRKAVHMDGTALSC